LTISGEIEFRSLNKKCIHRLSKNMFSLEILVLAWIAGIILVSICYSFNIYKNSKNWYQIGMIFLFWPIAYSISLIILAGVNLIFY